ncbi:unnamed protein product [Prunus armeniaca]
MHHDLTAIPIHLALRACPVLTPNQGNGPPGEPRCAPAREKGPPSEGRAKGKFCLGFSLSFMTSALTSC